MLRSVIGPIQKLALDAFVTSSASWQHCNAKLPALRPRLATEVKYFCFPDRTMTHPTPFQEHRTNGRRWPALTSRALRGTACALTISNVKIIGQRSRPSGRHADFRVVRAPKTGRILVTPKGTHSHDSDPPPFEPTTHASDSRPLRGHNRHLHRVFL